MMENRCSRKWLAIASLFLLAACSGSDAGDDSDAAATKLPPPICPQVAIVRSLDTMRDYGGEKPAPDQLVAEAKMTGVDGDCAYNKDNVDIAFDLDFVALRGPRLGGLHASFPFFVAVVDPEGNILNKEMLTVDFGFSSDERTADDAESLHVVIPLTKDKRLTGPDYRVLMGFQLTKGEKETQ